MRTRSLLVTYVVGVALLAVWVVSHGPTPNETIYAYDTTVAAMAVTIDSDIGVQVVGVDPALLDDVEVHDAQAAVVLTTSADVTVGPSSVSGSDAWSVQPLLIEQADHQAEGPVEVRTGSTLVALRVAKPVRGSGSTSRCSPSTGA